MVSFPLGLLEVPSFTGTLPDLLSVGVAMSDPDSPVGDTPALDPESLRAEAQRLLNNSTSMPAPRNRIPPAADPRHRLVERAMVAQGFLTAEELRQVREIAEQVGGRVDELRQERRAHEEVARQAGEVAKQLQEQRRAEREERRRRKQTEAAERKQQRAEAIDQRRANDIVFIGRGVSYLLNERQSDLERLRELGVPLMSTPAELAAALGLPVPRLRWLTYHAEVTRRLHYINFTVPKKGGGTRRLSAPHRTLAVAQQWVLDNILSKLPVEAVAQGFVPGRSILTNAVPHAGKSVVINMDLKDFFPSITLPRIRRVFQRAGYSPAVATLLGLLCTECPRRPVEFRGAVYHVATGPRGLPQGACTSPALSNQVARRLDLRLGSVAGKLGAAYTRYADDLSFSGGEGLEGKVGYLMARVRHIAAEEGFRINEKKSRVFRRNAAQCVTGLVVNDRPGVCRKEVRRVRAILHKARAEGLTAQNHEGRPDFLAWLRGKIAFIRMARADIGTRLWQELEAILQGNGPNTPSL